MKMLREFLILILPFLIGSGTKFVLGLFFFTIEPMVQDNAADFVYDRSR